MSLHYVNALTSAASSSNNTPTISSSSSLPSVAIKTISRNPSDFTRTRTSDIYKQFHNPSSLIHPHERAREYIRALNATKLERIFAKPFLYALDHHKDTVTSIALSSTSLTHITTSSADGSLIYYDLQQRAPVFNIYDAHNGTVKGVVMSRSGDREYILSCGQDQSIKMYNIDDCMQAKQNQYASLHTQPLSASSVTIQPTRTWLGSTAYNAIDTPRVHSRQRYDNDNHNDKTNIYEQASYESNDIFVTAGNQVDIWNIERSQPLHSYSWGCDTINTIKCNYIEPNIIASTASDRNIVIYDIRSRIAVRKIVQRMQTNSLCFHPQEAYIFATASEDTNACKCYTVRVADHWFDLIGVVIIRFIILYTNITLQSLDVSLVTYITADYRTSV
jgi:WD repeat and SOF domain-containing protein 1